MKINTRGSHESVLRKADRARHLGPAGAARCGRGDQGRAHESGYIHTGIARSSRDVKVCEVTDMETSSRLS
jgi:hypothetical protein